MRLNCRKWSRSSFLQAAKISPTLDNQRLARQQLVKVYGQKPVLSSNNGSASFVCLKIFLSTMLRSAGDMIKPSARRPRLVLKSNSDITPKFYRIHDRLMIK